MTVYASLPAEKILFLNFPLSLFVDEFLVYIDILICYLLRYLVCPYLLYDLRLDILHEQ